ncbi:protein bark beetle-like isoform X3 [Varroa jacobsoni]|uniref:protein bark beetle-like isoform X3 n=1 Tax=Varroa jacobsoni TaxID=62625 RepID=UPI000BF38487|nr:protein bark beetle-like isoform X3 [Varroa jacobsoni]
MKNGVHSYTAKEQIKAELFQGGMPFIEPATRSTGFHLRRNRSGKPTFSSAIDMSLRHTITCSERYVTQSSFMNTKRMATNTLSSARVPNAAFCLAHRRENRWRLFQTLFVTVLLHVVTMGPFLTLGCDALEVRNRTMEYPKSDTEYRIQDNIIVGQGGIMIVHPGVSLYFEPGIGINVEEGGVIIANGTVEDPILLTSRNDPLSAFSRLENREWPDARLVDGDAPNKGRLQVRYKSRWMSVCTNSKNWTLDDLSVVCRHLGFGGGAIYRWFEKYNYTEQLSLQNPRCTGQERRLEACEGWDSRLVGSGICEYHLDVGIQCSLKLGPDTASHWKGLNFDRARASRRKRYQNRVDRLISKSVLSNVVIRHAGRDRFGQAVPSLHVQRGSPPVMSGVIVEGSAYTAVNISNPDDSFIIQDAKLLNNRGPGLFINSSHLQIHLRGLVSAYNGADGIHYVHHDFPVFSSESFCSSPMGTVFPLKFVQISTDVSHGCERTITIPQHQRNKNEELTLVFKDFRRIPLDWDEKLKDYYNRQSPDVVDPTVSVYDGPRQYEEFLLGTFVINNYTRPQTFSSKRGYQELTVVHRAASMIAATFSLEVYLEQGKVFDINCTNCELSNNNGRGILAREIVSGVALRKSRVAGNNHVAGVHVHDGAGDIILNMTTVENNIGDGINVTYAGGYRHFDRCTIQNNTMNGIILNTNHTSLYIPFNYTVHVSRSSLSRNGWAGVFFGNSCLADALWNVSMSSFSNNGDAGVYFESCHLTKFNSFLYITHNKFFTSKYLSIKVKPLLNTYAFVENNVFQDHLNGALLISNQDVNWSYANRRAYGIVKENWFRNNRGSYVAKVGVMQESNVQELLFTNNVLEQNRVSELFPALRPRSRVAAVVAVESNNTAIYRNRMYNPNSKYELGVHLEDSSKVINATYNYWSTPGRDEGERHARQVYGRIFDRKDRYNLARVEFLQYLTAPYDLNTRDHVSLRFDRKRVMTFDTQGNTHEIGGEIAGDFQIGPGDYTVRRDIYVRSNAKLTIHPQTKLYFEQSVGLMVQGELRAVGSSFEKIHFTAFTDPSAHEIPPNEDFPLGSPVILSQGTYGRVEVVVNGRRGGICNHGFGEREAAVVCHQLGYIMADRGWQLEEIDMPATAIPAVLSHVHCREEDRDIFACRGRVLEDVYESNACTQLVGIRCFKSSWSGIRLGPAAKRSAIEFAEISTAGQLDYSTHAFKPALQIDMNSHDIKNVRVDNNMASGIGITWNNIFAQKENPSIQSCTIEGNNRHGIETRGQGLDIYKNVIQNNEGAGVFYNPVLTREEHLEMRQWIPSSLSEVLPPADRSQPVSISLEPDQPKFLVLGTTQPGVDFEFEIKCRDSMSVGLLVISPFQHESTENLSITKGRRGSNRGDPMETWDLRRNLTSFPLREAGYVVSAKYESGARPIGGAVIYLQASSPLGTTTWRGWLEYVPSIRLLSNTLVNNLHAFWSAHFNRDQGIDGEFYNRYSNESIYFSNNLVRESRKQAIYVSTPHWDPLRHQLAEINYTLVDNHLTKNLGGIISQYSRDIRSSNNLYHWTLVNCTLADNQGGVLIRLPYVLHYNENFTHSVVFDGNSYRDNRCGIQVDGHFARVNITRNQLMGNQCPKGVLTIGGMEKEFLVAYNVIERNIARYAVEIFINSHSEQFSQVSANFIANIIRDTAPFSLGKYAIHTDGVVYQPKSYTLAIKGVQLFNVSRNLFENSLMEFELVAGVKASSLSNVLNARENFWGKTSIEEIRSRIFDFDDWNSYAIADFVPFLGAADMNAVMLHEDLSRAPVDVSHPLGGRLYTNLTLIQRTRPYVIKSDLTVMPGATLILMDGVTVEVYPSVGILVLGDLIVMGREQNPVYFQPARNLQSARPVRKRQSNLRDTSDLAVRLCVDQTCDDNQRIDGFVEIFNKTTLQWVPVCDPRFTERNAQVVCSAIGRNQVNVQLHRAPRFDVGINEMSRVRSWTHPLECTGEETDLRDCEYRLNGYGIKDYSCTHQGEDFVYVYCGEENRQPDEEYWGGIRFSVPDSLAESQRGTQDHLARFAQASSAIRFAVIRGAGILHNEKAAAVQVVQRRVALELCNITQNAHVGLEVVASPGFQFVHGVNFTDNLGSGLNVLTLHGQTNTRDSNFVPLKIIDIPYNLFGLVDICDSNKEFVLKGRILVYFKYDSAAVDCIKIFKTDVESIGFRLLQFNLFNATNYSPNPDNIKLYDGNIFNYTSPVLGILLPNDDQRAFYETRLGSTLSVHLHATGGSEQNGFIAEVLPLPARPLAGRDIKHNVTACHFFNNEGGAIAYRSAGEITPIIGIRYNRVERNGLQLFGNLSSVPAAIFLDVQNVLHLDVIGNTILENQGGLYAKVDSDDSVSAVKALIRNNLFYRNEHRETLAFVGGKAGSLQHVHVFKNYVSKNHADHHDNILFHRVSMNFSENLVVGNRGAHQIAVYGFRKQLSSDQLLYMNYIWDNEATLPEEKATILAVSPGQIYRYNYLYNRNNYFELVTGNRSLSIDQESRDYIYQNQPIYNVRRDPIFVEASFNWWGFNEVVPVSGRIKDSLDEADLLKVHFETLLDSNQTLIDGHCVGGWKNIGTTCFLFVTALMNYYEAKRFCQSDAASLPYLKGRYEIIENYILQTQEDYDPDYDRVWVQSIDVPLDECPVLYKRTIVSHDCQERLPILCERTQEIFVSLGDQWYVDPLSIGALSVLVLLIVCIGLFSMFWCCKSHERHLEKMERRNSIRASIRSNKGFDYQDYKARIGAKSPVYSQGSLDSVTKLPFSASRSQQTLDYSDPDELDDRFAHDPALENANIDVLVKPTFDMTYENQGYHDQSRDSRDWSQGTGSTLDMKREIDAERPRTGERQRIRDLNSFNSATSAQRDNNIPAYELKATSLHKPIANGGLQAGVYDSTQKLPPAPPTPPIEEISTLPLHGATGLHPTPSRTAPPRPTARPPQPPAPPYENAPAAALNGGHTSHIRFRQAPFAPEGHLYQQPSRPDQPIPQDTGVPVRDPGHQQLSRSLEPLRDESDAPAGGRLPSRSLNASSGSLKPAPLETAM